MCGIVCAFDLKQKAEDLRPQILEMAKIIRHRGPDWSGIYNDDKAIMAHERLAIVDPASGKQPLLSEDKKLILAANGEIYNHRALRKQFPDYNFQTESDCEVILALYKEKGVDFVDEMNGIFGFAGKPQPKLLAAIATGAWDAMMWGPYYADRPEYYACWIDFGLKYNPNMEFYLSDAWPSLRQLRPLPKSEDELSAETFVRLNKEKHASIERRIPVLDR